MPEDPPKVPAPARPPTSRDADFDGVVEGFRGILQTYEVQVLGTMGLLIGYICVFFAKILSFTNIYIAVFGVSFITMMLMMLNKDFKWRDGAYWLRTVVVIFICLLITAPQLYFAWTVSVAEVQAAVEAHHMNNVDLKERQQIAPYVTIKNIQDGLPK